MHVRDKNNEGKLRFTHLRGEFEFLEEIDAKNKICHFALQTTNKDLKRKKKNTSKCITRT